MPEINEKAEKKTTGIIYKGIGKDGRKMFQYDWEILKLEFLQGGYRTVAEFRRVKGMKDNSSRYLNEKMSGWTKDKEKFKEKVLKKATEKLIEEEGMEGPKQVVVRHLKTLRWMQLKGIKALQELEPETVDEARKLILGSMEREDALLGLDDRRKIASLTQVNVNLPKTKFDKLIDELDYPGLLKLIAEVKRQRDRRSLQSSSDKSQSEARAK